jgi:hypothetical protein
MLLKLLNTCRCVSVEGPFGVGGGPAVDYTVQRCLVPNILIHMRRATYRVTQTGVTKRPSAMDAFLVSAIEYQVPVWPPPDHLLESRHLRSVIKDTVEARHSRVDEYVNNFSPSMHVPGIPGRNN